MGPEAAVGQGGRLKEMWAGHSGLRPATLITLAHFSISSAMSLPKLTGEPGSGVPPKAPSCALILESVRHALMFSASLPTISVGVLMGATMPTQLLAS